MQKQFAVPPRCPPLSDSPQWFSHACHPEKRSLWKAGISAAPLVSVAIAVVTLLTCGQVGAETVLGEDFDNSANGGYWTKRLWVGEPWDITPGGTVSGGLLHLEVTPTYLINYFRLYETNSVGAVTGQTQYSGKLLGNITGQTSVEARFQLVTDNLPAAQQFTDANFTSDGGAPCLRLMIVAHNVTAVPGSTSDPTQYSYWFSKPVMLASMSNKVFTTLRVNLDPAEWSSWFGRYGTYDASALAGFNATMANVGRIGFAFGSVSVANSGVGYAAGITGELQLDYLHTGLPSATLGIAAANGPAFSGGNTTLTASFVGLPNRSYIMEHSTDLITWEPYPGNPVSTTGTGAFSITLTAPGDLTSTGSGAWRKIFFRTTK